MGIEKGTKGYEPIVMDRSVVDAGMIAEGSIAFDAGDDLTTEKKTGSVSISMIPHKDDLYVLNIDKPTEDTAGDLTIYIYNESKVDGTNSRDCLVHTLHVEKITGAGTFRSIPNLAGLFFGEGAIKIGMKFDTDSGAITVYYKLYRM